MKMMKNLAIKAIALMLLTGHAAVALAEVAKLSVM